MFNRLSMAALAVALSATSSLAATEVTWWHAMGGELGKKLEEIATKFNESQSDYKVVPVYKGSYPETLTAAIAAFRANQQPAIVQVFEVGTGTMMAAEGAVYPVYKLMADEGEAFDTSSFLSPVVGYYSDTSGNILSLPFNSSTPIMYYNKDVFEKAGLDPEVAPKTWAEVEEFSKKIVSSGAAKCGFTSAWITWVQTENLSALHDKPFGTLENGFGGMGSEFEFNGDLQVKHWANLKKWQDEGLFKYGGPVGGDQAATMFYAQECAITMNSSAGRAGVINNAKDFTPGFAPLPYYEDEIEQPKNSIIGGATLWVLNGKDKATYTGVAKFFSYLSQPEVQADWHQFTGYLPITNAAYDLGKSQGYYTENPGSDIAIEQITRGTPSANSKGLRFGNFTQVRTIVDEEFQSLMAGNKDAKQALDSAVERGNTLLREFEAAN
ncbi:MULTISPECIES: sn-glycerol-3-phosphate ABC transporter substrate-binding protein UgpB [Pseudorhizobium]|uniref:sn-glycerol-3-phosphate ABC transporter substrate-binding protein UgpB n=1 Tax=Pseudorhizobium TaxID=1903858 RepID=UPI000497F1C0|nr:sn-glycerol-3-phosphate ABC transporter substrate-binding protein UgpB [Pseudorhizobium marinum]MBU1313506.1 sn-glycerol-3-phosphate ABC transporter substrate-binding protein UgpB [Alphaproteobacteria bacterium]MBU1549671.1 sn-glycerol-3-phosphate ABC transporter substrate-binding protein UgpB [Alphaproteobacteria bacterium]MBU2335467.1 sn-glycerol-3-phosphate ABC transporter substrate-binding protein UgpB [Alphaproteobacteria bacterium]MBU2389754.1 sn-glycerol-3-phosphate ABC transporter su